MLLRFKKLTENAHAPTRATSGAAGLDLYSAYPYSLEPWSKVLVKTDLYICIPDGCYGRIAPRSGLAAKNSIHVGGGVIDSDFRGNICVILFNLGPIPLPIAKGARIAQLIFEKITIPTVVVEDETILLVAASTERGDKGFGSTGQ